MITLLIILGIMFLFLFTFAIVDGIIENKQDEDDDNLLSFNFKFMDNRLKATFKRFIKALVGGFITGVVISLPQTMPMVSTWGELSNLLPSLFLGLLIGGLNGLLMATEKYIRWGKQENQPPLPQ